MITYRRGPLGHTVFHDGSCVGSIRHYPHGYLVSIVGFNTNVTPGKCAFKTLSTAKSSIKNFFKTMSISC